MGINVTAPGQTTVSGHQFLAKTPETFGYDADGNLTNDGRWSYYWDAENRLTNMTSLAGAPNGSLLQMIFTYDYQGRRIQKLVEGAAQYTNLFVYDGWNPIASLNPNASILASFMWGTGMSGSMQGAGGVGALLAENLAGNGVQFVAYDGNGNVAALVNAKTGTVTANYEYGPFGEVIRATGPMAKFNPFMFSTKFYDWESGLYYYGARYYNPNTGRWLSRDPMEEPGFGLLQGGLPPMAQTDSDEDSTDVPGAVEGGDNFYMFVANDPVQLFDFLGLRWKVTRNGGAKAPAVPEAGDTVAGLANLIGLNASEYQKWLTADPGTAMPTFANEILVGCGQFEIPNTVVAEWAGNLGGLGRWWVRWNSSVKYLGKLGFNVDNKHHSKGATEDLKALLQSTSNAKELHGLYFWGHGSAPYPSDGLYSDTGDLVLKFSSPGLNYHMALGLVFACDSNSGQTALMSGTSAQIWKGFTGTLVPWPFKAYHAKHYIRPGQQETH
jgi:RHS repeat-associated protein